VACQHGTSGRWVGGNGGLGVARGEPGVGVEGEQKMEAGMGVEGGVGGVPLTIIPPLDEH